MRVHAYRLTLAILFVSSCVVSAAIEMPGIFSDHMVLQRDRPVPIWGRAAPGEKVKISFRGQTKETLADSNGCWSVSLDAMQALPDQKPDILTVEDGDKIEFKDVLVGEVWLGSGQSNMVWPVSSCRNGQEEIAAADEPMIRLSSDTLWPSYATPGTGWVVCTTGTVRRFSALMYYFGRDLQRELKVPVGLICRAVAGSAACPWISTNGFMEYAPLVAEYRRYSEVEYPVRKAEYDAKIKAWELQCTNARAIFDARIAVLETTNYEAEIVITNGVPVQGVNEANPTWREGRLRLKCDGRSNWVVKGFEVDRRVGVTVEKCDGSATQTQDTVTAETKVSFRQATNAPAWSVRYIVRVTRKGGDLAGTADVTTDNAKTATEVRGTVVPLATERTPNKPGGAPSPGVYPQSPDCGGWYVKFINPVVPYAIRGVLWDQGEGGTGYGGLRLSTVVAGMVASWRKEWGNDFPFLFVQKPSGGGWHWDVNTVDAAGKPVPRPVLPPTPGAAFSTNSVPGSYTFLDLMKISGSRMCISSDLDGGLHPFNKHDYAHRLAQIALADAYGRKIECIGPVYKGCSAEDAATTNGTVKAIRVYFDHIGSGLTARGGEPLQGFSIAGADRNFVWANARIDGDSVVLWSDKVPEPRAVQYAWSESAPWANLFNKDGFPALIFRADLGDR